MNLLARAGGDPHSVPSVIARMPAAAMESPDSLRTQANGHAFRLLCDAEPVLEDVLPAIEAVPDMKETLILASGPTLPWEGYIGGQRDAIVGGAMFEGLARDAAEAERKLASGEIRVAGCQTLNCIGSLAGIYTASMPVFVVRNRKHGNLAYCNLYEGTNPRRLNYGVYDEGVRERLSFIASEVAPVIGETVRAAGGIPLKPIMTRALHMGDELHSRSTAASLLLARELFPHFLKIAASAPKAVETAVRALTEDHYFFLRLSMAAAKATADGAHGVPFSSVVTAMAFNCRGFAIRVSGLGDRWFHGPHPTVEAKLFQGRTPDDIAWMGGESPITETIGLGAFAQAAAFPLQVYQGGTPETMVERNLALYRIAVGENADYKIPFLRYRGSPTGIDIFKVLEANIPPQMDIGVAGKGGGQIGAGTAYAPIECFAEAAAAYREAYPDRAR